MKSLIRMRAERETSGEPFVVVMYPRAIACAISSSRAGSGASASSSRSASVRRRTPYAWKKAGGPRSA